MWECRCEKYIFVRSFAAFRTSLMWGEDVDCHMLPKMIGEIKVFCDWFRCVFVVRFCSLCLRHEGVLGIGSLVVSPFHQCITFCKECKLCSRWQWLRYTWNDISDLDGSLGSPHFLNVARVNGILSSFSRQVCCTDCRSICWARWWPSVVQAGPFIRNVVKMWGPKRSIKITDHFTCTSANVICCSITCTLCRKLYIGETGRQHLRDIDKDDKNASKPVAKHVNLSNHSKQHMAVCSFSLHQGRTESRNILEQKFTFQIGTLNPHGINERFSFN